MVREVSDYLGNTPAVARASYIDPRVVELYEKGTTIAPALGRLGQQSEFGELATQGAAEAAVLRLLSGDRRSARAPVQPGDHHPGGRVPSPTMFRIARR